ncbi:MAG TPA: substrate-binding domain-containing protein [Acetobacteraceae bacterium]|nr:substrate-binding domain-containing protein [Acetobacteraceae bacterium]
MRRGRMRHFAIGLAAAVLLATTPAAADSLRVFAAGSLTDAFSDLLRRFPAGPDGVAPPVFGPSGLLRERIENGEAADLLASADMAQARRLALGHPDRMVIEFTRNRLCAIARNTVGLTEANMLDRLLDPAVRLATSTPGADPGGDYAWAIFARADALHPGARAILEQKAQKLVGGGDKTPLLAPGKGAVEGVFLADRADVMLGYCSGGPEVLRSVPSLVSVAVPPALSVGAAYGMALLDQAPVTLHFAAFVMSETGQAVLAAHGFDAVALPGGAEPQHDLLVQRRGRVAQSLTLDRIGALKPVTQTVSLTSEHGTTQTAWTGPLLWDVLASAGAIDPANPREDVHLVVRVTGADGYTAAFALGELSPAFADKAIQLADRRDDAPLPRGALRLVVPGERRAGRSVQEVVRIEVDDVK